MSDSLQLDHFAVGSRAIVHPYLHGNGLGTELVKKVNNEIYSQHGANAIFGSSTNLAAINLYLQNGAELWAVDVKTLLKNSKLFTTRLATAVRYLYRNHSSHISENINHLPFNQTNQNSSFLT